MQVAPAIPSADFEELLEASRLVSMRLVQRVTPREVRAGELPSRNRLDGFDLVLTYQAGDPGPIGEAAVTGERPKQEAA